MKTQSAKIKRGTFVFYKEGDKDVEFVLFVTDVDRETNNFSAIVIASPSKFYKVGYMARDWVLDLNDQDDEPGNWYILSKKQVRKLLKQVIF